MTYNGTFRVDLDMTMPKRSNGVLPCIECGDMRTIARKLCRHCYNQHRKAGTLKAFAILSPGDVFDSRVEKTDGCWIWKGTTNGYGYGIILMPGEIQVRAHRFSFERSIGPIPTGMVVRHTCDNPPCVRPEHLILGTKADNNRDTAKRRRHNYGLAHWNGRLSPDDILAILQSPLRNADLARRFNVDPSHISRIKSGQR